MPLLAQGAAALEAVIITMMVLSFAVLGLICWIFWKAKKREDAEVQSKRHDPS